MNLKWDELSALNANGYRQLRFPIPCEFEIYYAIDTSGNRCILFYVNDNAYASFISDRSFKNIILEGKSIYSKTVIVLTLQDIDFSDIFDYFIASISQSLIGVTSEIEAVANYLQCYNKWAELFQPVSGGLTETEIMGLIAELLMLEYILSTSNMAAVDIVASWKGPYGKGHDFELDNLLVEVKAINSHKQLINISSEYQLDYLEHQRLFLAVYRMESESSVISDSINISKLVKRIGILLRSHNAVTDGFWKALNKAGVSFKNIYEYDAFSYKLNSTTFFYVDQNNFPALKRSDLPEAITDVKYQLSIEALNEFRTNSIFN